jgi:hypothetical protein
MPSFLGTYRTSYLEGYLFGGLSAWRAVFFVCDFVSFLSPWMDQLSFRYQMVYAIYDDRPFIVLTETKFSLRCIPVWIGTLLTGLGSKKKTHVIMFSP